MQTLSVLASLVVLTALPAAMTVGPSSALQPHSPETTASMQASPDAALSLRQDMRKLWSDHVIWTRDYIIAATGDQPDQKAAAGRLMKNQEDIGGAVSAYYGKAAGDELTGMLKEHIQIAVDLINAAKAQDQAKVKETDGRWHKNAEDIATFLSKANPNWTKASLVEMM